MAETPEIRVGDVSDIEAMVATLSESFARDPMLNWVIPHPQLYPYYFHLLLAEVCLPRGMIHVDREVGAVALWLPPEERFQMAPRLSLLKLAVKLFLHDGPRSLWRLRQQGRIFANYLPSEPHYYLQFLGCRTEQQGQGIGSALIAHGTGICDDRGMPAYLESSNRLNVPLYERHGFEVIAERTIGNGGPTVWFMWRDAR